MVVIHKHMGISAAFLIINLGIGHLQILMRYICVKPTNAQVVRPRIDNRDMTTLLTACVYVVPDVGQPFSMSAGSIPPTRVFTPLVASTANEGGEVDRG